MSRSVAVVVPVYRNGSTLAALAARLDAVLTDPWTLRLVVDACPDGSGTDADAVASADPRVRVTHLPVNVGQHRALATGLRAEPDADRWVCMDGDLQDPPEALPALLEALDDGQVSGVFAGRRGVYESLVRRATGVAHRRVLALLTDLPVDAGAFLAMDRALRDHVVDAVLDRRAPSVVVAAGVFGLRLVSVPVERDVRREGTSAWTSRARLRQSLTTLRWAFAARVRGTGSGLLRQGLRFGLVGVLGVGAYLAVYLLLRHVVPAQPANVVSRVTVALAPSWLSGRFVFAARVSRRRLVAGTLAVLVVTTAISAGALALEQVVLGPDNRLGEVGTLMVAQVPAAVARFWLLRNGVFAHRRRAPARSDPTEAAVGAV